LFYFVFAGFNVPSGYFFVKFVRLLPLGYHFVLRLGGFPAGGHESVEVKIGVCFLYVFFVHQRHTVIPNALHFVKRGVVKKVFLGGGIFFVIKCERLKVLDFFVQIVVQFNGDFYVVANYLQDTIIPAFSKGGQPLRL